MKEILIIEDVKLHQEKIKSLISELGYNIVGVFSYGEKALNYIFEKNNKPDLIIIDIVLKGEMDGYEVAQKITSKINIPIIFLTGMESDINHFDLDNLEASVYLNKPFTKRELKNNIELVLHKYEIYKKLQYSIKQKELLLENINTKVWYLKGPQTYGAVNKAYADLLGFDVDKIEGKRINEFVIEKEAKRCIETNKKVFSTGKQISKKEWVTDKNGKKRLLYINKTPCLDENTGEVNFVVCSAKDITSEHRFEQSLKRNRNYLQSIINTIPDILILLNEKGDFLDIWTSKPEELAAPKEELIGKNIAEFFPETVKDEFKKQCFKAIHDEEMKKLEYELDIEGNKKYYEANLVALDNVKKNNEILATIRNITERKKNNKKLKKITTEYEIIFDNVQNAIFLIDVNEDKQFEFQKLNNTHEDLTGLKTEKVRGKTPVKALGDELGKKVEKKYRKCFNKKETITYEETLDLPVGKKFWLTKLTPVIIEDNVEKIVGTSLDITERKKLEKEVKNQNNLLEGLIDGITDIVGIQKPDHTIIRYNQAGYEYLNMSSEEVKGKKCYEILGRDEECEKCATRKALKTKKMEEVEKYISENNTYLNCRSNPILDEKGEVIYIVEQLRDITERKKREEKIKHLSFHDQLTGLYNRRYFEQELERLDKSRRLPVSIVVADMDGLKYINDNYGHQIGDQFIKNIGDIFGNSVRKADIVARVGGDEFSVILPDTSKNTAYKLCNRIKNECRKVNKNSNLPEPIAISLGAATKTSKRTNLHEVFNKADQRMYQNKGRSRKSLSN